MNSILFLLLWTGLVFIISAGSIIFTYRKLNNHRMIMRTQLEQADNDLFSDLRNINLLELEQTSAGRELLSLIKGMSTFAKYEYPKIMAGESKSLQKQMTEQEFVEKMRLQSLELEKTRAELLYRQEVMARAMDAIGQAFSASAYPMDPRKVEIIQDIIRELKGKTGQPAPETVEQKKRQISISTERIDTLTETLLNWFDRNKSER